MSPKTLTARIASVCFLGAAVVFALAFLDGPLRFYCSEMVGACGLVALGLALWSFSTTLVESDESKPPQS